MNEPQLPRGRQRGRIKKDKAGNVTDASSSGEPADSGVEPAVELDATPPNRLAPRKARPQERVPRRVPDDRDEDDRLVEWDPEYDRESELEPEFEEEPEYDLDYDEEGEWEPEYDEEADAGPDFGPGEGPRHHRGPQLAPGPKPGPGHHPGPPHEHGPAKKLPGKKAPAKKVPGPKKHPGHPPPHGHGPGHPPPPPHEHGPESGPSRPGAESGFGIGPGAGWGFGPGPDFGLGFGWGPGGARGRRRGPGRRARLGDVRAAILSLLAERPMYGYEMIQEITERSQDLWRPSPGSVYPTLQMLDDEGLIVGSETGGSQKLFELTDDGRAAAEKIKTPPWDKITKGVDSGQVDLRAQLGQLIAAVTQAAYGVSAEHQQRIVTILKTARREIYSLLAEAE
jgi:DNA-binding PadR family transcriptional regulator